VVQSVYCSFFRRLNEGRFAFDDSHDVWRLLAAMTFHKARNLVQFHERERRDVRRDLPLPQATDSSPGCDLPEPREQDLAVLYDSLEQLLAGLPEQHRTILVRRLEGHSIEEVARQVRRSRRTVLRVLALVHKRAARQLEPTT